MSGWHVAKHPKDTGTALTQQRFCQFPWRGAVALGIALYRGPVARRWVLAWNSFGLADFVVAVSVGVASSSPVLAALSEGVTGAPMQVFPLILIPGFFVPLYVITHVIVFLQLRRQRGVTVDLARHGT